MAKYIDYEAAISETKKPRWSDGELRRRLACIPAADVRPVMHGKWVRNDRGDYNCSNCKGEQRDVFGFFFCPYCGASMEDSKE